MSSLFPRRRMTLEAALRQLGARSVRARVAAAEQLGHPDTLPGHDHRAPKHVDEDTRRAAEALREALADRDWEVRYAAAFSLGELGDREAVPALIDRLDDGSSRARQAAAIALGRIGDRRAIASLRTALREGTPDLRYQAATSLAAVRTILGEEADDEQEDILQDLARAVGDDDPEVREAVAAALGELGEPRAAGWLGGLLDDPRPETRFEAAFALARLHDRRAVPALLQFVERGRRTPEALEALLLIPDERAREPMRRLCARRLEPPVIKVRAAAVLAALGDEQGRRLLCDRLRARRLPLEVRGMTVHVLTEIAGPWAEAALAAFLATPASEPFREVAEHALARARAGAELPA